MVAVQAFQGMKKDRALWLGLSFVVVKLCGVSRQNAVGRSSNTESNNRFRWSAVVDSIIPLLLHVCKYIVLGAPSVGLVGVPLRLGRLCSCCLALLRSLVLHVRESCT